MNKIFIKDLLIEGLINLEEEYIPTHKLDKNSYEYQKRMKEQKERSLYFKITSKIRNCWSTLNPLKSKGYIKFEVNAYTQARLLKNKITIGYINKDCKEIQNVKKFIHKNLSNVYVTNENEINLHVDISLNEGYLNQLSMGFKIHPKQKLEETLKKHTYEGFLNLVKKTKKAEDLEYLRKDVYTVIPTIKKISERIINCKKLGECKETQSYYKNIKKKYLDKGINEKDCELTIKWFKEVVIYEINRKIKEIRENSSK